MLGEPTQQTQRPMTWHPLPPPTRSCYFSLYRRCHISVHPYASTRARFAHHIRPCPSYTHENGRTEVHRCGSSPFYGLQNTYTLVRGFTEDAVLAGCCAALTAVNTQGDLPVLLFAARMGFAGVCRGPATCQPPLAGWRGRGRTHCWVPFGDACITRLAHATSLRTALFFGNHHRPNDV